MTDIMVSMLEDYEKKRHFERTPEPGPPAAPRAGPGPLTFVVHKHSARRLHYDLRLELDGVLKSWAIPRGPSSDPKVKRLAVMVEDHPLDYGSFEGIIPPGEYGAGPVIIWDRGTYSPEGEDRRQHFDDRASAEEVMRTGLDKGKISLFFRGEKLQGSWALVKMARRQKEWLLIKHQDEAKPTDLSRIPGARSAPFPEFVPPMLATLTEKPFSGEGWIFEPKLDGYRSIAMVRGGVVRLLSRRGNDHTRDFPGIASALRDVGLRSMQRAVTAETTPGQVTPCEAVFDGEIVALDELGHPSFQSLQRHMMPWLEAQARGPKEPSTIVYYVFDIIYLDGYDLTKVALRDRKQILASSLTPSPEIRLVEYFPGNGESVYRAALDQGFEGIIAKRSDSAYQPARRSGDWLKVKAVLTDEFVIGGYSQGLGGRAQAFGALLVGQYDENARLIYSGHVGAGFDEESLIRLKQMLDRMRVDECPFAETPPLTTPAAWVRPELVAEIKFAEWTRDGRLRTPVYLGLREDKPATEIRRARVIAPPGARTPPEEAAGEPLAAPAADKVTFLLPGAEAGIPAGISPLESLLRRLQKRGDAFSVRVEGNDIDLNNLDKELWPAFEGRRGLTKRDLLVYLAKVSSYLLPHLKDRPLTLKRYPDGIHGQYFYQKHWPFRLPGYVETTFVHERKGEQNMPYIMCNNLATLIWLGQLADIELHTWFSRISPLPDLAGEEASPELLDYPDFIIFDLDPYIYSGAEANGAEPQLNRAAFSRTCEVALWLKEILDSLSFSSFVRTSGRTGIHVYMPIIRNFSYHQVQAAAGAIGKFMWQKHPRDITLDWTVQRRTGMVFFDYNQNVYGKTLASIYSPRASPEATVATPLAWGEVEGAFPTDFTILTVPDRLARTGDLWAAILDAKGDLKGVLGDPFGD